MAIATVSGLAESDRAARDPRGERFALEVLHHQEIDVGFVTDVVQRADVRMAQRRDRARLALEPLLHLGVVSPMRRQHLDGDRSRQPRVRGFVDFAHAAGADRGDDFVGSESSARAQRHVISPLFGTPRSSDGPRSGRYSPARQSWCGAPARRALARRGDEVRRERGDPTGSRVAARNARGVLMKNRWPSAETSHR